MHTTKTLFFLLTLFLCSACADDQSKSLTVMTWNIWHGGLHGDRSVDFEQDTLNTENVLKVIPVYAGNLLLWNGYC